MLYPKTRKLFDAITAILKAPKGQEIYARLDLGFRTMSVDRTDRMALLMLDELRHRVDTIPANTTTHVLVRLTWWAEQLMSAMDSQEPRNQESEELLQVMTQLINVPDARRPPPTFTVGGVKRETSTIDKAALHMYVAQLREYPDATADELAKALVNASWWFREMATAEQENKRMEPSQQKPGRGSIH